MAYWDSGISIEGIPFIIRFKTDANPTANLIFQGIEGIPFIIRFKTISPNLVKYSL